ncbi:MAG: glycosyl hydrolase family 28 protein [Roseibacillus sp.]
MLAYPFAPEFPRAEGRQLKVDETELAILTTDYGDFSMFAASPGSWVTIELERSPKSVVVRPLARGIEARLQGNVVKFQLPTTGSLSVEFDGDIRHPILLFVDDPIEVRARVKSPSARVFTSGKIHDAGEIHLADGEQIFLEPGAIVRGVVRAEGVSDISITGSGFFDSSHRQDGEEKRRFLSFEECQRVSIDGVGIIGSYGWTIVPVKCRDVRIRNVKVFSNRDNDDGLDICNSREVLVDQCFFHTKDDNIAVKGYVDDSENEWPTKDIEITRSVFWNTVWGNALEIGFELRSQETGQIHFHDNDIIRVEKGAAMSIHNGGRAVVSDILFKNLRFEDVREQLIELQVGISRYSWDLPKRFKRGKSREFPMRYGKWLSLEQLNSEEQKELMAQRGRIQRVRFKNLHLQDLKSRSQLQSITGKNHISEVSIDGVFVKGERVQEMSVLKFLVTGNGPPVFR